MTGVSGLFAPRTVTVVDGKRSRSARLEGFRSARAYVLLGDPGAGKTRAFRQEQEADSIAEFVTVRRFIRKSPARVARWEGRTLFIDGLDEARAGGADPRRPLDLILERLERLSNPRFRISCRAADWLGRNDLQEIMSEVGYGDVGVLHLEPLTDRDIQNILVDLGESDPHAFLRKARQRGLEGLLDNPQLLRLLVEATRDGEWPADRSGVLELACRKLANERNEEHRAAQRAETCVPIDEIIAAAGQLSALLLMSDRDRVSLDGSEDPTVISPEGVADGDQAALVNAVRSNLFEGRPDGGFEVVHRLISEFLAARFLHDRIEAGVPAGRVLALMAGGDGVVVNELRGLAAWLAAFDPTSRSRLVETDPVGVALYGDVSRFRGDDVERLLRTLTDRADEVQPWTWPPQALTSLVTGHSVDLLSSYLNGKDRTEGTQVVVDLLLRALSRAVGADPRIGRLEKTVRDDRWHPQVRHSALLALRHHCRGREVRILIPLLDELRDGRVEDRDGELLGTLLRQLYPQHVGPERVWDYLVPRGVPGHGGSYRLFWSTHLIKQTGEDETARGRRLATLLGTLCERWDTLREAQGDDWPHSVVCRLVGEALAAVGDHVTVPTICDWLELIDVEGFGSGAECTGERRNVTSWLAERPKLQKALALESLRRIFGTGERRAAPVGRDGAREHNAVGDGGEEDAMFRSERIKHFIFRAGEPNDFRRWCLDQAVEWAATSWRIGCMLLHWSQPWHDDEASGSGLSVEDVRRATAGTAALQREVERLRQHQRALEARKAEWQARREESERKRARRRQAAEFIAHVREHASALRQAKCNPGLLHHIGEAYHDFFHREREATPWLRVLRRLHGHTHLADAAVEGFRRVVEREDLPTLREILRLNEREQMSLFALPVLAGFDLMSTESLDSRSPAEIARAVAFYLVTPLNVEGHPKWYRHVLEHRPKPVAEALITVTRSRVRGRRECLYLWDLARNESYCRVVRLAALPLFPAFPTRCTEPQVSALHQILLAALRCGVEGLDEIVDARAAKPDVDAAQRAKWLAAGLLLSPDRYAPRIASFLEEGGEARSRHLVKVLAPRGLKWLPMHWRTRELGTMIDLLGSRYSPWWPERSDRATIVDEDRERVEGLISTWANTLASRTEVEATEALHSLADDPDLEPWHFKLRDKRAEQVVARRSATFAVPDLDAVHRTLANAEPANPADLAALVVDRLERLGCEISRGNTDDWRQFWNEDRHRRPTGPKHEESCRDALLSDLRHRLPAGVDAQPEARYARQNESDFRVFFGSHAIPVEVKKDSRPKLWSAVAEQLVPKYASAPESSGFGVYLVLWFGQAKMPVPPVGRRPKTPEELRDRLQEQLTGPHRHKISVLVLDVSGSAPGRPPE